MKIKQLCLAMLAATTMWSCAKDESMNIDNAPKAISMRIATPDTKALTGTQDKTDGTGTLVINPKTITVRITGTFAGDQTGIVTFVDDADLTAQGAKTAAQKLSEYTFFNVLSFSKIEAFINYEGATEANHVVLATSTSAIQTAKKTDVSCYGKVVGLDAGTKSTKVLGGVTYDLYTFSIGVVPAVARIEASGVKITDWTSAATATYKEIKYSGIFLNNACESGNIETKVGTGVKYLDPDATTTTESGLFTFAKTCAMSYWETTPTQYVAGVTYPATATACYAFNFFVGTTNPQITLAFEGCKRNYEPACDDKQFAFVTSYKDKDDKAVVFEPGNIYRIANLAILEKNIGKPGSPNTIVVEATVVVTPWTIKDVNVEWK